MATVTGLFGPGAKYLGGRNGVEVEVHRKRSIFFWPAQQDRHGAPGSAAPTGR